MITTPDWWPHNVESWIELTDYFSDQEISDSSSWKRLPEGQSNYNYKLSLSNGQYFVQAVNPRRLKLLPDPRLRISQLELSKLSTIRPWLVECFVDNIHLKISEWFESGSTTTSNSTDDGFIFSLAQFLIHLHSIEDGQIKHLKLPRLNLQQHLTNYHQMAIKLNSNNKKYIDQLLDKSLELSQDFLANTICHNDLSPANLLWNKSQATLKIIDWEYACISDPIMDIATLIVSYQLTHIQEQQLIEIYCQVLGTSIEMSKLSDMKALFPILVNLWEMAR